MAKKEYIEREAFKAEIRRLSTHYLNEWDTLGVLAAADRIHAADVRPVVRGRWEVGGMFDDIGRCSNCHYMFPLDTAITEFHFCPNCGARMEES